MCFRTCTRIFLDNPTLSAAAFFKKGKRKKKKTGNFSLLQRNFSFSRELPLQHQLSFPFLLPSAQHGKTFPLLLLLFLLDLKRRDGVGTIFEFKKCIVCFESLTLIENFSLPLSLSLSSYDVINLEIFVKTRKL